MDSVNKDKAEKLQVKLDKLINSRSKKQAVIDKTKQELSAITKEIDSVKLKIFEILQSGSDADFSSWAKSKISEKSESGNNVKLEKSEKPSTPNVHNQQSHSVNSASAHSASQKSS